MAFRDSLQSVWEKLNEVPFSGKGGQAANLTNGGHTGYVPVQQQPVRKRGRFSQIVRRYLGDAETEPAQGSGGQQVPSQAYDPAGAQFVQSYDPNYVQQPNQVTPPAQNAPQSASGYVPQQPVQGGGFVNPNSRFNSAAPVQLGSAAMPPVQPNAMQGVQPNYGQGMQPVAAPQPENRFGSRQMQTISPVQETPAPQPAPAPQTVNFGPLVADNSHVFQGADGVFYRHVEELATITRLADCYHLMEYMLDTRTVIVSMDMVQDSKERQRCADLLFGAAYSMGCSLNRISMTNTYLISPRSVLVHASRSMDMLNQRDAAVLWPGSGINDHGGYEREEGSRSARGFRAGAAQQSA